KGDHRSSGDRNGIATEGSGVQRSRSRNLREDVTVAASFCRGVPSSGEHTRLACWFRRLAETNTPCYELDRHGDYRAGRGFAKPADVDATIHHATKAWAAWFGRDECPGCVNKNLSGFSSLPGRRWSWGWYRCRSLVPDNNRSYARPAR